jgi:hypothetical protein
MAVTWTWRKIITSAGAPKFVNCILWGLWECLKWSEICECLKLRGWNISVDEFDTVRRCRNLKRCAIRCQVLLVSQLIGANLRFCLPFCVRNWSNYLRIKKTERLGRYVPKYWSEQHLASFPYRVHENWTEIMGDQKKWTTLLRILHPRDRSAKPNKKSLFESLRRMSSNSPLIDRIQFKVFTSRVYVPLLPLGKSGVWC